MSTDIGQWLDVTFFGESRTGTVAEDAEVMPGSLED